MKFLCTVSSIEEFLKVKNLCDGIVITNHLVSSRFEHSLSLEEILALVKKCNTARMECYLMCNALFTDDTLPNLYDIINHFKDTNLLYIFGDLAVYELLKEFGITKKGVYFPDTLVSNYLDFTFFEPYKLKGMFPTLEIPLDDVKVIGKNKKLKLYYKGFGKAVMFHSKRKLLTSYALHKKLDSSFIKSDDLYLIEETRSDQYKILENEHGTHIFQKGIHNILPALDIIYEELDYLFLDGTYLPFDAYLKAVEIYRDATCDLDYLNLYNDRLEKIFSDLSYDFLFEDSVFRKGDF